MLFFNIELSKDGNTHLEQQNKDYVTQIAEMESVIEKFRLATINDTALLELQDINNGKISWKAIDSYLNDEHC